jgi:hypothetical protein
MSTATITVSGDHASIVVRGFSGSELRRCAERDCCRLFGGTDGWRFTNEQIAPCLRTAGGRTRLYEGRFEAVGTTAASN